MFYSEPEYCGGNLLALLHGLLQCIDFVGLADVPNFVWVVG
jgi:hypothetical protein